MARIASIACKALLVAAFLAAGASMANAQYRFCTARNTMISWLEANFAERQIALGTINSTAVMEIYVGDKGTWTIILTDLSGTSCMVAAGEHWTSDMVVAGEDATDS